MRLKAKGLDVGGSISGLVGHVSRHNMLLHYRTNLMRNLGVTNACHEAVDLCEVGPCRGDPLDIVVSARMIIFQRTKHQPEDQLPLGLLIVCGGVNTTSQANSRQIKKCLIIL